VKSLGCHNTADCHDSSLHFAAPSQIFPLQNSLEKLDLAAVRVITPR
jgi:hypothetical protein